MPNVLYECVWCSKHFQDHDEAIVHEEKCHDNPDNEIEDEIAKREISMLIKQINEVIENVEAQHIPLTYAKELLDKWIFYFDYASPGAVLKQLEYKPRWLMELVDARLKNWRGEIV
jgi:hypothetical protein